jgi:hypothetical protein
LDVSVSSSTQYEFEYWLQVNSTTSAGLVVEPYITDATLNAAAIKIGGTTGTSAAVGASVVTGGVPTTPVFATDSTVDWFVHMKFKGVTGSTETVWGLKLAKITSGTATLRAGSRVYYRLAT